ncbi:MAG: sigma-70 family RNA polymerase sigma factor [Planctomycetes bacterium]|nr:sigma-70 family RNA polymerase sigma factor [Planctomycetota bacterium]
MQSDLKLLFLRWREHGDLDALASVFDATAPALLKVALHLARRRDEAEDLVQSTFVTALERSSSFDERRELLPWLSGILAMHARKRLDGRSRDAAVEALEPASGEDPLDQASARELEALVARALDELPATYARAVREHVQHGVAPRELAAQLGVSRVNARARLHRGLKLLRRALPASLGARLIGASDPLERVRTAVLTRGAHLTGAGSALSAASWLAGALALTTVVWGAVAVFEPTSGESTSVAAPIHDALETSAAADAQPESARSEVAPEESTSAEGASSSAAASSAASTGELVHVRGRLLLPNGAPAVGVPLRLSARPANDDLVARFGVPESWTGPTPAPTDAEGRFEVSFEPPRAFQFSLEARPSGFVPVGWRFSAHDPDPLLELAPVQLERAATVVVNVRDAAGADLRSGWSVSVRPAELDDDFFDEHREESVYVPVEWSDSHGAFVADCAPAGPVSVSATHLLGPSIRTDALARLDDVTAVQLLYAGPDLARRIAVALSGSSVARRFPPETDKLRLVAQSGVARTFSTENTRATGRYWIDDVEPGVYVVELEDERYYVHSVSGVQPSEFVKFPALPAGALRIAIVDEHGAALPAPFSLGVTWPEPGRTTSVLWLRHAQQGWPAGGVIDGLIPEREFVLELRQPGALALEQMQPALAPGEVRDIVFVRDSSRSLRGTVLTGATGAPASGVVVELTRGDVAGHDRDTAGMVHVNGTLVPLRDLSTHSDANGRFEFSGLHPGVWTVCARWDRHFFVEQTVELAEEPVEVELAAPPHATLLGRLLLPAGYDATTLTFAATPKTDGHRRVYGAERRVAVAADGSFAIGPLQLGVHALTLWLPPTRLNKGEQQSALSLGQYDVGAVAPLEIDLRQRLPGAVRARILIDGAPAAHAVVGFELVSVAEAVGAHSISLDARGEIELQGVPNGVLRACVRSRDGRWWWRSPTTFELSPGATAQVEHDLTTFERAVRVVHGATQAPIAHARVALYTQGPNSEQRAEIRADELGRVSLRAPAVRMRFELLEPLAAALEPAEIDWGPGADPLILRTAP